MIEQLTPAQAVDKYCASGQTIMVGGFGRGGTPFTLIDAMADHTPVLDNLTLAKNDANEPNLGIGVLIQKGLVKKLVSTHIGLNPDAIALMNAGKLECELVPQGIFAEKIRAGGAAIPAFLSDIGIDTIYAKKRERTTLDGKEYLLERALTGDVAIMCADKADTKGNLWWKGSNRNMCTVMATACTHVIAEAREIVPAGEIEPESVHVPGAFVSAIVQAGPRRHQQGGEGV